ncbi:hypothetical protein ILUMI_08326 [Ignelater luminosus]|uniref:Uncharacterized protein n=1 Tax=Ignelater luminosus TaxID=2038154 RepID=A0A8K0DBI8_IGNLU|nr:hypothetical protein ILUMI_08326 [Ignelater luminosus]
MKNSTLCAPTSPNELVIDGPYSKTSSGEDFLLFNSGAGDPNRIFLFSTETNLEVLFSSDHWFCDGTFQTALPLFTQLMTIHGLKLVQLFFYCTFFSQARPTSLQASSGATKEFEI